MWEIRWTAWPEGPAFPPARVRAGLRRPEPPIGREKSIVRKMGYALFAPLVVVFLAVSAAVSPVSAEGAPLWRTPDHCAEEASGWRKDERRMRRGTGVGWWSWCGPVARPDL